MQKITAVKGMNDILPSESYKWLYLEEILRKWLLSYGYSNIRTPIVENTGLFVRSIGEGTDIVDKEMYTFIDSLNGDSLTLRPEGTASVIRSSIENNILYNATAKLWYIGPMFRHERPQKGRYRQFYQLGVEALGFADPQIDAEIIQMQAHLWNLLGLTNLELQVNCLGNKAERAVHRAKLIEYFEAYQNDLDEDSKVRLYKNPLRILDSKNPQMQELISNAPKLYDFLEISSKDFHHKWLGYLDDLGISYSYNDRLVRGLDYYNLSVFEWVSSDLGAQATVCAGGRYDPLIKELGGKDNYAIGFAMGLERLLLVLDAQNQVVNPETPQIFIAALGENTQSYALKIAQKLRASGFSVVQNLQNEQSLKSQLRKADGLNVKITLLVGEDEVKSDKVTIKFMDSQDQQVIACDELLSRLDQFFNR